MIATAGNKMKLSDLITGLECERTTGKLDVNVAGIEVDSRKIVAGGLFVAVRGTSADGYDFTGDAVKNGAVGIVSEKPVETAGVANVVVKNSARALARLSARFFGEPARGLFLCGVTGTNGKTSTTHLYRSILNKSKWGTVGIVGTLGYGSGNTLAPAVHTTPDAIELHRQFRNMVDAGSRGVVMEVSSHAVRQHRIWGLDFDIGILTNVTHDHLDYHRTLEDYRAAKEEFCKSLAGPGRQKPPGILVYSNDDDVARSIGERFEGRKISVGGGGDSTVYTSNVNVSLDGTTFTLHVGDAGTVDVNMKLLGTFCAVNSAMAAAGAYATGIDATTIKKGLESLERIPGRFEAIGGRGKPVVILDYSHTADAMERILLTCRGLNPRKLYTVFGCGGDRDREKRPLMGRVAQTLSDFCYITMDNPRTEPIDRIVEDILSGMDRDAGNYAVDLDRSRVIHEAVNKAGERDVVALLGKGHENYQVVGREKLPFSDRAEAEGALRKWRAR